MKLHYKGKFNLDPFYSLHDLSSPLGPRRYGSAGNGNGRRRLL